MCVLASVGGRRSRYECMGRKNVMIDAEHLEEGDCFKYLGE